MHNLSANLAEIAALGVGMSLLVAWITYVKTARIRASLMDLAQDDSQSNAVSAMASRPGDSIASVGAEESAQGGVQ